MGLTFNDYQLIKNSGLFDPIYYLYNYPDVRIADIDPLRHFMKTAGKKDAIHQKHLIRNII